MPSLGLPQVICALWIIGGTTTISKGGYPCCGTRDKKLNKPQENERRWQGRNQANPNLNLISVDSIYEPIAALADIGAPEGTLLFICPADDWGYLFSKIIEELSVGAVDQENGEGDEDIENQEEEESIVDSELEQSDSSEWVRDEHLDSIKHL